MRGEWRLEFDGVGRGIGGILRGGIAPDRPAGARRAQAPTCPPEQRLRQPQIGGGSVSRLDGGNRRKSLVRISSCEGSVEKLVTAVAQAQGMPAAAQRSPDIDAIAAGNILGVEGDPRILSVRDYGRALRLVRREDPRRRAAQLRRFAGAVYRRALSHRDHSIVLRHRVRVPPVPGL